MVGFLESLVFPPYKLLYYTYQLRGSRRQIWVPAAGKGWYVSSTCRCTAPFTYSTTPPSTVRYTSPTVLANTRVGW